MVYCDFIADRIRKVLCSEDSNSHVEKVGEVQYDLHPTEGYFQSTKKVIDVEDFNGKKPFHKCNTFIVGWNAVISKFIYEALIRISMFVCC